MNAPAVVIERDADGFPVLMNLKQLCIKFHVSPQPAFIKWPKRPGFSTCIQDRPRQLQWYRTEIIKWVEAHTGGQP